jgi:hypothetical protein
MKRLDKYDGPGQAIYHFLYRTEMADVVDRKRRHMEDVSEGYFRLAGGWPKRSRNWPRA